jgi:hypothetical protein
MTKLFWIEALLIVTALLLHVVASSPTSGDEPQLMEEAIPLDLSENYAANLALFTNYWFGIEVLPNVAPVMTGTSLLPYDVTADSIKWELSGVVTDDQAGAIVVIYGVPENIAVAQVDPMTGYWSYQFVEPIDYTGAIAVQAVDFFGLGSEIKPFGIGLPGANGPQSPLTSR